jgi:O-antigen ligase
MLLFPFAYSTWRISDRDQIVDACLAACAAAGIGGLAFAMAQVHIFPGSLTGGRAEGGAGNALVFGNVVALAASVSLIGVFRHHGRRRLLMIAGFLAGAAAVAYSGSRAPLILFVVNTVLVLAIHARGRHGRLWGLVAFAALAAFLALFLAGGGSQLMRRFEVIATDLARAYEGGDFSTSVGLRVAMWQAGLELWLQKPLFGHGAGNIRALLGSGLGQAHGLDVAFSHFHNVFINTMVEGGLAGLVGLVAMIMLPVLIALDTLARAPAPAARFGATLLLVFFSMFVIAGMTNIVLHHDILDAVFMCYLAVGLFLATGDGQDSPNRPAVLEAEDVDRGTRGEAGA